MLSWWRRDSKQKQLKFCPVFDWIFPLSIYQIAFIQEQLEIEMKIKKGAESMIKLLSTEELAKQLKNSEAKIAALNAQLQELRSSPGLPLPPLHALVSSIDRTYFPSQLPFGGRSRLSGTRG